MKKTASILFLAFSSACHCTIAQTIQTKTLNTTGNFASSGNIMLEWNVGEMTAVVTLTAGNSTITQGLLQPSLQLQAPLPVSWVYVKAKLVNDQTVLEWKVSLEFNNDHFNIERSADGSQFSFLKKVNSRGNSSNPQIYTAIDSLPFSTITYYRLKQIDMDGKFEYSNIAFVKKENNITYKIFPNPATNILILEQNGIKNNKGLITIMDLSGKIVRTSSINGNSNQQEIHLSRLSAGAYFLKLEYLGQKFVFPFVKQ